MFTTTEGVVLRQINYDDYDKILTVFTKDSGKIQAIAKGARKTKSSLIASTQLFCHSEFSFYKGKTFYHINSGEVISSYFSLREDLKKLAYATYIIELADAGIVEEEPNLKLFELLVKALYVLSNITEDFNLLVLAFEIKYISFLGYRPHMKSCVLCNNQLGDKIRFNSEHGGAICENCITNKISGDDIDKLILRDMEKLLYSQLDKLQDLDIKKENIAIIERILLNYILGHLDRKTFKSLEFINIIKE